MTSMITNIEQCITEEENEYDTPEDIQATLKKFHHEGQVHPGTIVRVETQKQKKMCILVVDVECRDEVYIRGLILSTKHIRDVVFCASNIQGKEKNNFSELIGVKLKLQGRTREL